ncbi:hypothetical protein H4R18_001279 [Coemansia javaensis]|uniref:Neurochondrin n=1 Tax=Coemansia javaensis TaxID=2761396 RepID=A0A9W8LJD6_9FUNG|nr:hypothetical protein H4R18_001279 [Coemansia javaensis]
MEDGRGQLATCARLLSRQSTDDEKLAGLLLLPRVVDPRDRAAVAYVFEALDCRFVGRLLRTGLKQAAAGDTAMLSVAVSVVDLLASHGDIASDPRLLDRMPGLFDAACVAAPAVAAEAVQALCKLLAHDAAVRALLGRPDLLAGAVDAAVAHAESLRLSQFIDYALDRCSRLICGSGKDCAGGWVAAVGCVAAAFRGSGGRLKFELLPAVASALEPLGAEDAAAADRAGGCARLAADIGAGCVAVLQQRTEVTAHLDQALVLYSHLARLWPGHVFRPVAEPGPSAEAELALRLACVEGQAAIDAMLICAPPSPGRGGAQAARDADRARVRRGWKLPFCAAVAAAWLEWAARWLDDQPAQAPVDEPAICAVMAEVQKLAAAAVGFLVDWRERVPAEQDMLAAAPELVLCAVRLLGQWLATDPAMHRDAMPVLAMCASWASSPAGGEHSAAVADYMRPSVAFALETCGIAEDHYVASLAARELRSGSGRREQPHEAPSPWVGTMEFDDLARAVYGIPSDEDVLRARQAARGGR